MLVFGGCIQTSAEVDLDAVPEVEATMHILNLTSKNAKISEVQEKSLCTSSQSSFLVADDCLLLCGGVSRQLLLLTDREIINYGRSEN